LSTGDAVLATAIAGLNPHYIIASSSSMDYVYSIFFGLLGVTLLRQKKNLLAAIAFSLAVSSRLSNILLIGAIYLHFLRAYREDGETRESVLLTMSALLTACLVSALYIPSFLVSHHTLGFLTYRIGDWSFLGHLYRFLYKNVYLFGLIPFLFVTAASVWKAANRSLCISWTLDVQTGVTALIVHELLFFKVPLEIAYLLPLLFVSVPLGFLALRPQRVTMFAMAVLVISYGFVVDPDILSCRHNEKAGGTTAPIMQLTWRRGLVVRDVLRRRATNKLLFEKNASIARDRDTALRGW